MSRSISPPPTKRMKLADTNLSPTDLDNHSENQSSTLQSVTIYSHNINGIAPYLDFQQQPPITAFFSRGTGQQQVKDQSQANPRPGPPASLRSFLHRHAWPHLLFLQELKLKPKDTTSSLRALKISVRAPQGSQEPDYLVFTCLPQDQYNAKGRVYGVMTLVRQDFHEKYVEQAREVDWDQEGRFLILETRAVGSMPQLAIINVYMVNGTDNPYRDPSTGAVKGTRHDRKVEVHALLQAECRSLQQRGFGVVVAGDVNVARDERDGFPRLRTWPERHVFNRRDFVGRFLGGSKVAGDGAGRGEGKGERRREDDGEGSLGMIDTFRHLHPEKKGYTYYPRGRRFGSSCDRVDMILISSSLEPFLKEAGMHETPAERGTSDHVPLFARLEFTGTTMTQKEAS